MIVYGLSAIMLLLVCLVTPSSPHLAGTFVFFLFCLEFPDYSGPLSFFVFIPRVTIFFFVYCCQNMKNKKNRSLPVYFQFFTNPADELWH